VSDELTWKNVLVSVLCDIFWQPTVTPLMKILSFLLLQPLHKSRFQASKCRVWMQWGKINKRKCSYHCECRMYCYSFKYTEVRHIIFNFTRGMPYSSMLFAANFS